MLRGYYQSYYTISICTPSMLSGFFVIILLSLLLTRNKYYNTYIIISSYMQVYIDIIVKWVFVIMLHNNSDNTF